MGRASGHRNRKGGGKGIAFIISGALGICIGWILCLNVAIDLGSTTNISESRVKHGPTTEPKYEGQGWKNIPVFVGGEDLFEKNNNPLKKVKKWYGEHEQDLAVTSLLSKKTNGFFVDLAANHPTFYSNTYSLETKFNWTGLCIEPNSDHWWGLAQARNCQLVGAVVGQKTMDEVKFRVKNVDGVGGHGGIIGEGMKNERAPAHKGRSFYTVTLDEVFHRVNAPHQIDFLSLDVEGAEEFVMRGFPFKDYRVSLINIESASPSLQTLLVSNGFKMIARLGKEDTLWAHESVKAELNPPQLSKYRSSLQSSDPKF